MPERERRKHIGLDNQQGSPEQGNLHRLVHCTYPASDGGGNGGLLDFPKWIAYYRLFIREMYDSRSFPGHPRVRGFVSGLQHRAGQVAAKIGRQQSEWTPTPRTYSETGRKPAQSHSVSSGDPVQKWQDETISGAQISGVDIHTES